MAVGVADGGTAIAGVHPQEGTAVAVGQDDDLGLAGLAAAVELAGVSAALPGHAAVIGIHDAGDLIAGVVVQREHDALGAVAQLRDSAAARADAGEALVGKGGTVALAIQVLHVGEDGIVPLKTILCDGGAADQQIEGTGALHTPE